MNKGRSSFDRVNRHLQEQGCNTAVEAELREDLEALVRRCDEVRGLSPEYGSIGLSPYMSSLLRVSGVLPHAAPAVREAAVAGV